MNAPEYRPVTPEYRYLVSNHRGEVIAEFRAPVESGNGWQEPMSSAYALAGTNLFVLDASARSMSVYRAYDGEHGRYIGSVDSPDDIQALLKGRCAWCAFPVKTGYLNESDQRTPRCLH
jgi:hypothetical protein